MATSTTSLLIMIMILMIMMMSSSAASSCFKSDEYSCDRVFMKLGETSRHQQMLMQQQQHLAPKHRHAAAAAAGDEYESSELLNHEMQFEKRACFCDKHCRLYRDCCSDYETSAHRPSSFDDWHEPQLAHIKRANRLVDCNIYIYDENIIEPTQFKANAAFSINKCVYDRNKTEGGSGDDGLSEAYNELVKKCTQLPFENEQNFHDVDQLSAKIKDVDYLQLLPVTVRKHNWHQQPHQSQPLTYRNIYCAVCNDLKLSLADIKDIEFWELGAACVSAQDDQQQQQQQSNKNCIVAYRKSTTTKGSPQPSMSSMNNNGVRKCKQSIGKCLEDENDLKLNDADIQQDIDRKAKLSGKCYFSQGFTYDHDLRYKNRQCALCNNIEASRQNCTARTLADLSKLLLLRREQQPAQPIDFRYENNRVLFNQSLYQTVLKVNYQYEKRRIKFRHYFLPKNVDEEENGDDNGELPKSSSVNSNDRDGGGGGGGEDDDDDVEDESEKRAVLLLKDLGYFNITIWSLTYSTSTALASTTHLILFSLLFTSTISFYYNF